jgi:hypothetical protein
MKTFYILRVFLPLFFLSTFSLSAVYAQAVRLSVGFNAGASRLLHQTRFETTPLRNLYETIRITHPGGYNWDAFAEDFKLRQEFNQARFGFSGMLTHRDWPIIAIGEAMTSSSTYERFAFGLTVGLGKEFFSFNKQYSYYFMGGYKLAWDQGFGANTLVKSIGHEEARDLISTYFSPEDPLGSPRGNLLAARGGIGRTVDRDKMLTVGVDAYAELDITPSIKRESRMTNYGFNVFVRFSLNKTTEDARWLPDFYYRQVNY